MRCWYIGKFLRKMEINWKMPQILAVCTGSSWLWSQSYIVVQFKAIFISMKWWSTGFVAGLLRGKLGFKLFLPFALILLNKFMENKPFFLRFLSRYKDCDATTTHRYDHRIIPKRVFSCTLRKKHNFVYTEGWYTYHQLCASYQK